MIRGVNKNIIEISSTGNEQFERAILFIRPDSAGAGRDELFRRADEYLSGLTLRRHFYARGKLLPRILCIAAGALAGAGIMFFFLH